MRRELKMTRRATRDGTVMTWGSIVFTELSGWRYDPKKEMGSDNGCTVTERERVR